MKLPIGEKIALLRKERNVTQTELAEYLVLAPQTISRWEVGNGAPEISLLPQIAAFFNVSIDELFGLTSLERAEDLVAKYSVLRDDRSFRDAMECIDSQLQTIDALLKKSAENTAELERDRDQLEAEKMHMWIQQGREAFQRALQIADAFVRKTEGNPEHPWYMRMRLQQDQLRLHTGRGRETLAERRREFMEQPNAATLQRCLSMLSDLQDYEEILSIQESESRVREIVFPPSEKNLDIWWLLIQAAAETGETAFIDRYMPSILEICGKEDEVSFLMCLLDLYRGKNQGEKLEAIKQRLRSLLPEVSFNKYFVENIRKRIEQACP